MPSVPSPLLDLVEAVAGDLGEPKTIALFVSNDDRPVRGMEKPGDVGADELLALCRICAETAPTMPESMLLATWRPGRGATATDHDRSTWDGMRAVLAGTTVRLVDWLLIDGADASSLATGCHWDRR